MSKADRERVVVVTGGTGGLGRWIVRHFAASGSRLHLAVREPADRPGPESISKLEEILAPEEEERIAYHACDVTVPSDVSGLFDTVMEESGRVDILVNVVGGFALGSVEETEPESWQHLLELNATSAFLCCRSAVPAMKKGRWGRIVNVSSLRALERGSPGLAAYGASKSALLHLTMTLAREVVEHGITVNAILPSVIDTPANRAAMPDHAQDRWLDPKDIARVVDFLVSDAGGLVTGGAIPLTLS